MMRCPFRQKVLVVWSLVLCILSTLSTHADSTPPSRKAPAGSPSEPAWGYWPKASNPEAWYQAHKRLEKTAQQIEAPIVFIGDSITQGWLKQGKEEWTNYINLGAINLGIGGDSTRQIIWRLQNGALGGHKPELVVLMIGTNNILNSKASTQDVIKGIDAIIQEIHNLAPKAKILLLPPPPLPLKSKQARMEDLIEAIQHIKPSNDVTVLDTTPAFVNSEHKLDGSFYREDHIHPNALGYQRLNNILLPQVLALLAE